MKELQFTSTPSDFLIARSNLYTFASALFSSPDSPKFSLLRDPEFKKDLLASCKLLDTNNDAEMAQCVKDILKICDYQMQEEFVAVFGHTLSSDVSLYEMGNLKYKDVFAMTQNLADIAGFYNAFGLKIDPGERADNFIVEAEFLGFLLLKEALALQKGEIENAKICNEAGNSFWHDHFSKWLLLFVSSIKKKTAHNFYKQAAHFLNQFHDQEISHFLHHSERQFL